jgi:hypothetical protein
MSRASRSQLDKKELASRLTQLVAMYYNRNTIECNETGVTVDVHAILNVLKVVMAAEPNEQVSRDLLVSVKSEFRWPKVASKALIKAFQKPSVDRFRAEVCSWKAHNANLVFSPIEDGNLSSDAVRKAAKSRARASAREKITSFMVYCNNPKCPDRLVALVKQSRCSVCKDVHYCSRDCQIADWKAHKQVCCKPREERSGRVTLDSQVR